MDEKVVLSRCLAGSYEAFEVLVNKYQAAVLRFAGVILGDRETARDITQETFIQAFLNFKLFDTKRSFKTWLYTIAYRKCIDSKRREKLFLNHVLRPNKAGFRQNKKIINSGRLEDSNLLGPVLQKLSRRERIAVLLQMNDGYSTLEISEVLQCSESTARVTLFNARRKISKILEGDKNVWILQIFVFYPAF